MSIETDLQAVELEADRTRILQLLTNLLVNAIQYNRRGDASFSPSNRKQRRSF